MNTKHISLAVLAMVAVLAACTKNPIESPFASNGLADLELSYVGATETKAAIDGTTFPTDGEIGLFLFEDEQAAKAYGTGYENVKYAYNSTKEKWTASTSIKVGSTPGYLYGYYPYCSGATDIKSIPVNASLNGDDVMYAAKQNAIIDKTASQTSITMNHALARVSITVKNNGYTGEAKLSQIKFEGAKIASSGTLNALDGTISATKADKVALSVPTAEQTIATGDGTTYECLLVPSEINSNRQDITLSLTIDGEDKTAALLGDNGVIIAQGTKSNITITLSNSGISVHTVSVEDWNVVEVGGHKVIIQFDDDVSPNDVLVNAFAEETSVIVRASSFSGQRLKCTMSDGKLCTSQSKTAYLSPEDSKTLSKFDYTFTVSDITDETVATISYAKAVSMSASSAPMEAGTVTVEGELYEGEAVKLTAKANEGYDLANWQDKNGKILCESKEYVFRPAAEEVNVTAVFQKLINLKVFVIPSFAGSVSTFDTWNVKGTEITLTTTPGGNSVFNGWKDKDGNTLTENNSYIFTIESDTVLIADYSANCGESALDGVFTVAEDNGCGKPKKVRFSKGNLYWCGDNFQNFMFETNQYDFQRDWSTDHVSHFYWSKDADVSCQSAYSDTQASENDVLFTNTSAFTVNGVSVWYTLSRTEWEYLLGNSTERSGKYKLMVTVNETVGLVIAPDKFNGDISEKYTADEWKAAEAAGLVFLPAAGHLSNIFNNSDDGIVPAEVGYYWTASLNKGNFVSMLLFNTVFSLSNTQSRNQGCSIRLVTDVTE